MDPVVVLGVQEFEDTAKGVEALDAMAKAAPITILEVMTVTPARFVVLITGDVASVESSLEAGRRAGGAALFDELFIPNLNEQVLPALHGSAIEGDWDAIGILESGSVTAGIAAGDRAAKRAAVRVVEIRADSHMGGRSAMKLVGSLSDVEIAMVDAREAAEQRGRLVQSVIIPRPHADIRPFWRNLYNGNR